MIQSMIHDTDTTGYSRTCAAPGGIQVVGIPTTCTRYTRFQVFKILKKINRKRHSVCTFTFLYYFTFVCIVFFVTFLAFLIIYTPSCPCLQYICTTVITTVVSVSGLSGYPGILLLFLFCVTFYHWALGALCLIASCRSISQCPSNIRFVWKEYFSRFGKRNNTTKSFNVIDGNHVLRRCHPVFSHRFSYNAQSFGVGVRD